MFDFLSYVRDSGFQITLLPPHEGELIHVEIRDASTGFYERHVITDREASSCGNIDIYTGKVLDAMAANIGRRKAQLYANRFCSKKRQDIEDLIRDVSHDTV